MNYQSIVSMCKSDPVWDASETGIKDEFEFNRTLVTGDDEMDVLVRATSDELRVEFRGNVSAELHVTDHAYIRRFNEFVTTLVYVDHAVPSVLIDLLKETNVVELKRKLDQTDLTDPPIPGYLP